jgi:hypothetical protein
MIVLGRVLRIYSSAGRWPPQPSWEGTLDSPTWLCHALSIGYSQVPWFIIIFSIKRAIVSYSWETTWFSAFYPRIPLRRLQVNRLRGQKVSTHHLPRLCFVEEFPKMMWLFGRRNNFSLAFPRHQTWRCKAIEHWDLYSTWQIWQPSVRCYQSQVTLLTLLLCMGEQKHIIIDYIVAFWVSPLSCSKLDTPWWTHGILGWRSMR